MAGEHDLLDRAYARYCEAMREYERLHEEAQPLEKLLATDKEARRKKGALEGMIGHLFLSAGKELRLALAVYDYEGVEWLSANGSVVQGVVCWPSGERHPAPGGEGVRMLGREIVMAARKEEKERRKRG